MNILDNENPLHIYKFPDRTLKNSGRPRKNEKIIFSPPPRSIVSRLLSKNASEPLVKPDIICNSNDLKCESMKKGDKQWVCRQCQFRTCNRDLYKEHMTSHKNQLNSCDYANCTYSTKSSSNLIKHKRTHTGEKPYICDKCVFRTNFQNSLTVHRRIHTLERPYACQHCQYKCNSSSNLKKHCNYKHPKTESVSNI